MGCECNEKERKEKKNVQNLKNNNEEISINNSINIEKDEENKNEANQKRDKIKNKKSNDNLNDKEDQTSLKNGKLDSGKKKSKKSLKSKSSKSNNKNKKDKNNKKNDSNINKEKSKMKNENKEKEKSEKKNLETERLEKEKFEKEKIEKEKLEREKLERERLERERIERERKEKEKMERERLERERLEKERIEKERIEKERIERERIEKERIEKERIERERLEKERLEKEALELEKKEYKELMIKFEEINSNINSKINNVNTQENFCKNFKIFIDEFISDINDINSTLHISVIGFDYNDKIFQPNKEKLFNEVDSLSKKFNKYISVLESIENNIVKKIKNKYMIIQENLNENEKSIQSSRSDLKIILSKNNDIIKKNINDLNNLAKDFEKNESSYENLKKEIENDIQELQKKGKQFNEEVEKKNIERLKAINEKKNNMNQKKINYPMIDKRFLKNSMLLGIDEFSNPNDIFSSRFLFNDKNINYHKKNLLRRNWKEICYVYEDYDIYDVHFELKAVGLEEDCYYNRASIGFTLNRNIEIIEFEIDGKKSSYNYMDSLLEFDINLNNLESNQIHMKYKESENMSYEEKKGRKLYRTDWYGISKNLAGQNATFTLLIKCEYEIIGFEKGYFTKIKEGEYKWGGEVPNEGKKILVKMSRKTAKFNFNVVERIESLDKKPLEKTTFTVNSYFKGGNNQINKLEAYSNQTKEIKYDEEKRHYELQFINTNSYYGEFIVKGQLINRCKGEWKCDLTNEEIEKEIPDDYKYNKEKFKEIALDIIKNYDKKYGKDITKVTDFVKIGEWVKENIKYDISYHGRNEISATEIYNNGVGVCHHFTKLYNALIYSLGYQCIYVSGYAIKDNDCFNQDDGHAWSLIKVNDKWLPFDATWGIFSGKLPVCHIFEHYFNGGKHTNGTDSIKFGESNINGQFIE